MQQDRTHTSNSTSTQITGTHGDGGPPILGSNSLAVLAADINEYHAAASAHMKRGIAHAIAAGQLLIEAKARLDQHGKWLPWLEANCQVPERTAQLYMRLARHAHRLVAKSATVADLTIRGAIEALLPVKQLVLPMRLSAWSDTGNKKGPPHILTRCADCGVGTIVLRENYMVKGQIWQRAWAGRLKRWHEAPGQTVLCVGCFEARIGRRLRAADFENAPVNDPKRHTMSERLTARLKETASE